MSHEPSLRISTTQLANIAAQMSVAHERLGFAIRAMEDALGLKFADAVADEIDAARTEIKARGESA